MVKSVLVSLLYTIIATAIWCGAMIAMALADYTFQLGMHMPLWTAALICMWPAIGAVMALERKHRLAW